MPNVVRRSRGALLLFIVSLITAAAGICVTPQPAEAAETAGQRPAQRKVVIVVGPVGNDTDEFKKWADEVALAARRHGARVVKVYSPNATWARVKRAAKGAHMLVYMGHGNGWPSPYGPFQRRTKNGLGLNARAGQGNHNHVYYGEKFIAEELQLARNAIVLLMHVCYGSGNSEWGRPAPTKAVAKQRVDNFGAGFLRAGARVVIAETLGKANYIFDGLFDSNKTMREIFWSAANAVGDHRIGFDSRRTPGARAILDPNPRIKGRYWRSIVGDLGMRARAWRGPKAHHAAASQQ